MKAQDPPTAWHGLVAVGSGRRVGAWAMLAGMILVVFGVAMFATSVAAAEQQIADLDESQDRMGRTLADGATGIAVASFGLLLFLIFLLTFAVSSLRSRKRAVPRDPTHGILAGIAGLGIVLAILYATVFPTGPGMLAASIANGGGGAAGGVQLETYDGNLTAANVPGGFQMGPMNAENVHAFEPVTRAGTLNIRLGSQGQPEGTFAYAILEVSDGNGGWTEVARTEPTGDSEVRVPERAYDGDVRFRVRLPDGAVGGVGYILAVSFDPAS